jgi:hypothetical protein
MDEPEKRIDLNSELGMTRRDLIRRGAIVGGTLLWVAPAIQSMAPKAFAQSTDGENRGSAPQCAACYCWTGPKQAPSKNRGFDGDLGSGGGLDNPADCQDFCAHAGIYSGSGGAVGGPYTTGEFCSGTTCDTNTQVEPGTNGAFCT